MSYNYFNPSTANDLARFQGTLAGIQAGNASYTGVATAPTSIYNQAGYHAFTNDDGTISLRKDADESLFTKKWYDQTSDTTFDFSGTQSANNSSSANSTGGNNSANSTTDSAEKSQDTTASSSNNTATNTINNGSDTSVNNQTTTAANSNNTKNTTDSTDNNSTQSTNNGNTNTDNNTGIQSYPWGNGYVTVNNNTGTENANGDSQGDIVDENGDQIEINAKDINDLVDAGAYSNVSEALNDLKNSGYKIPDDEQAKLGIYTEDSEKMISTMMDKLDISRDEAISKLSDKLQTNEGVQIGTEEEYYNAYQNLIDKGMSDEEATTTLEKLGYETPSQVKDLQQLEGYTDEDQEKILAVMQSTGCSAQEAINSLGIKKDEHGLIRSIGDFFGGIGQGIADGWNAFCSWLW